MGKNGQMLPPSGHEQRKRARIAMLFWILAAVVLTTVWVILRNGTDQPYAVITGIAAVVVGLIGRVGYIPF